MYIYLFIYLSIYLYLSLSKHIYIYIYVCISMYMCIHLSISISISISLSLYIYIYIYLSFSLSIYIYIYIFWISQSLILGRRREPAPGRRLGGMGCAIYAYKRRKYAGNRRLRRSFGGVMEKLGGMQEIWRPCLLPASCMT